MSLRSITLANGTGETIDAVLLFSFAVPLIGKNFLVYTLNEELQAGYVQLYIASLLKEGKQYSLGALESREDRAHALHIIKHIVKS